MINSFKSSDIDTTIADILSNRLPLIAKTDIYQIIMHSGYSQRQIDKALRRMKNQGLVRVAYRNARQLNCNHRQLPVENLSEEFIRSICETNVNDEDTKPTQVVSATARLAGLVGRDVVGDLSIHLLDCYMRLGRTFAMMIAKGTSGANTLEALWPARHSNSRVAYARFSPAPYQWVNLAAAQPKDYREAKRWLEGLIRLGGKYVLC